MALFRRFLHGRGTLLVSRGQTRTLPGKMAAHQFLFPGQGSQHVGMTEKLAGLPAVQRIFSSAERVLGYDLQPLCLSGPQSTLDETVHCQPAVVVASLAAVESLKLTNPEMVTSCRAAAGFSVGEITGYIFAGALSVESGLHLIKLRAEAMQEACQESEGSMSTIIGIQEASSLELLCKQAEEKGLGKVCIANYIFPKGFVVSGHRQAVDYVRQEAGSTLSASVRDVAVSGAFHSPLMASAVPKLRAALDKVWISPPKIPIYSNVTGLPSTSTAEIRMQLAEQVTKPVLWELSIRNMIRDSCRESVFVELGPGKQLKAMLKRISRDSFKTCLSVEV